MPTEAFGALALEAVINAAWQGMLVVGAAEVITRCLPHRSGRERYAVWCGAFGLALALPFWGLIRGLRPHVPAAPASPWSDFLLVPIAGGGTPVELSPTLAAPAAWLFLLLTLLGILRVALLVGSLVRLRRLETDSVPLPEPLATCLAEVLHRYGRRGVEIRVSHGVGTPSTIGFLRPVILLPASLLNRLSVEDWRRIALHEIAHVRRLDDWANLVQRMAGRAFFYVPAVGWAGHRMDLAREMACDEFVVTVVGGRRSYAECLTRVAAGMHQERNALAIRATAGRTQLFKRVESLVRKAPPRRGSPLRLAVAGLALGLIGAGFQIVPGVSVERTLRSVAPMRVAAPSAEVGYEVPTSARAVAAEHVGNGTAALLLESASERLARSLVDGPAPRMVLAPASVCEECDGALPRPYRVSVPERRAREPRGRLEPLPPLAASDRVGSSTPRLTLGIRGSQPAQPRSAAAALQRIRGFQTPERAGWIRMESPAPVTRLSRPLPRTW
ncbi:MAG: M56 family metallopeptidase [Gemmatimonadota bacterium]